MNQFSTGVVKELDASVLLRRDGDWKSRVTQDFVDLTGTACYRETCTVNQHRNLLIQTRTQGLSGLVHL